MPGISAVKTGIPFSKKGFNFSSYWTTQYEAVYNAMPVKPSNQVMYWQSRMLKKLVDRGYYAKAELIYIFATHSGGQDVNWKTPGAYDPINVNTPTFTEFKGYKGVAATSSRIRTGFNLSANLSIASQNDMCVILGIADDVDDAAIDFGGYISPSGFGFCARNSNNMNAYLNDNSYDPVSNTNSIGHYSINRSSTTVRKLNKNITLANQSVNSANIINQELTICGGSWNYSQKYNARTIPYLMLFKGLTDFEQWDIIRIMEEYLDAVGCSLITGKLAFVDQISRALVGLTTYLDPANDETIHPSVIDIGYAWNGYRYWMANTPFPSLDPPAALEENPSIWASNDLSTWVVPAGLTNPIVANPGGGKFNADPDLYYENGVLYCFHQENDGARAVTLKCKYSTNGITWSASQTITTDRDTNSPSVIKIGSTYYLYYMYGSTPYTLGRSSSANILGPYANGEDLTVTAIGGADWWHVDIFKRGDTYWLVIFSIGDGVVYIAHSSNGVDFTIPLSTYLMARVATTEWENISLYRASAVQIGDLYKLFYGCFSNTLGYHTGVIDMGIID